MRQQNDFVDEGVEQTTGLGGRGQALCIILGRRLWAQVRFGQPTDLRVPHDLDSTVEIPRNRHGVVGGDGDEVGCAALRSRNRTVGTALDTDFLSSGFGW